MSSLVHRDAFLVLLAECEAAARAQDDLVIRSLEVTLRDLVATFSRSIQGRFIDDIGEVGAREPRGSASKTFEVDIRAHRHPARVQLQDREPAVAIRKHNLDPAVEAPGTQQGRIEDVRTVGGGDDDDALVFLLMIRRPPRPTHFPYTTLAALGLGVVPPA